MICVVIFRRFFKPVQVSKEPGPHFGMGLDCYVQWSSPIRRLTDLQVCFTILIPIFYLSICFRIFTCHSFIGNDHIMYKVHAAIKRYLRRRRVNEMLLNEVQLPSEVTSLDLGCDITHIKTEKSVIKEIDVINYKSGLGMIFAARPIQTSSTNYWLFEYIRRRIEDSNNEVMFECLVLGCVDYDRFQYAIYVYELG